MAHALMTTSPRTTWYASYQLTVVGEYPGTSATESPTRGGEPSQARGRAGRPGERLALGGRLPVEVTLSPSVPRGDDRDREAAAAGLYLVRHLQHGGVEKLRDVVVDQSDLARDWPAGPAALAFASQSSFCATRARPG
jgi:hypothetical protein